MMTTQQREEKARSSTPLALQGIYYLFIVFLREVVVTIFKVFLFCYKPFFLARASVILNCLFIKKGISVSPILPISLALAWF